jgi:hypothetical protein
MKVVVSFLSSPCHTFLSLPLYLFPAPSTLLYAPLSINYFLKFRLCSFQGLCTPGKYIKDGVFIYSSEQEREGERMVGGRGERPGGASTRSPAVS